MIDIIILIVLGLVTWCVAAEGFIGATQICIIVIISGLLAMNFFEPLAVMLQNGPVGNWADVLALVGLFAAFVFGMRLLTERIAPGFPDASKLAYEGGRWFAAFLTGYVTCGFLLTALHTAPLPREFAGFTPERANFFGMAPDRQWLGFTQYVSEKSFRRGSNYIFDGPVEKVGEYAENDVWASFPIRYATRRDQIASAATPRRTTPEDIKSRQQLSPSNQGAGGGGNEPSGF